MIPISLNIKNKNILVIGGGNVALRKINQFLNEGAIITVVSKEIDYKIKNLPIKIVQKPYEKNDLNDFLIVYAATSSIETNNKVIYDANIKNILCGSATYNKNATFYSMAKYEDENIVFGLSTHQKLPYTKPLINQISELIKNEKERLNILSLLREYIIENIKDTKKFFESIYNLPLNILSFLYEFFKNNRGYIYIYHHSNCNENFDLNKKNSIVISLEEFELYLDIFSYLENIIVIPLVLSDGFIYKKIKKILPISWEYKKPLFENEDDIKKILDFYKKNNEKLLCIMHPRNSNNLKCKIQNILGDDGIIFYFDEEFILEKNQKYRTILLLMTHGKHFEEVIIKLSNYSKFYNIKFENKIMLDDDFILSHIKNKILD